MKRNIKMFLALFSSLSIALTGCSLSGDDTPKATEYLSDKETEVVEEDNAAASGTSIVVVEDLFEPILEELEHEDEIMAEKAAEEASQESSEEEEEAQEEESEESFEFKPVNMVFFGDSQLANGRSDGSDIPSLLKTRVPNLNTYNLAIGGTTCSVEKSTNDVKPESLRSTSFLGMVYCFAGKSDRNETLGEQNRTVLEKMNQIDPEDVDFYVIEYGANDFFENVPLDTQEYDAAAQAHCYYNAMMKGIEILKEISPKAHFFIMSPFYGIYTNDDGSYLGDSYIVSNGTATLSEYAEKARNVAEDVEETFIDNMFMTRCDLYLDTASQYLSDNVHLTLLGRQIFTRLLSHNVNFALKYEPYAYLETDFIKIAEYDTEEIYRCREDIMREYYPESWAKYIRGEFPLAQPSEEALAEYGEKSSDG